MINWGVAVKKKLSLTERLERQRLEAAALFGAGKRVYEVAARLGVTYPAALRWEQGGREALRSRGKPGPDKQLTPEQLAELERALLAGAPAAGYETGLWTLGRVRALIAQRFDRSFAVSNLQPVPYIVFTGGHGHNLMDLQVEFARLLRKRCLIKSSHVWRASCDHVYSLRGALSSGLADH